MDDWENEDVLSTFSTVAHESLGNTLNLPPSTPQPPEPAGLGFNTHPQPPGGQNGGYGGYMPQGDSFGRPGPMVAAPNPPCGVMGFSYPMQSVHMNNPPGVYNHNQYLPHQRTVNNFQTAPAVSHLAAPPYQNHNIPVMPPAGMNPNPIGYMNRQGMYEFAGPYNYAAPSYLNNNVQGMMPPSGINPNPVGYVNGQVVYEFPGPYNYMTPQYQNNNMPGMVPPTGTNINPVGYVNGQAVYEVIGPSNSAAPAPNTTTERERKVEEQQDCERPYVKKPPNAFMLFLREQRPNVVAQHKITNNATVNKILGQMWKSMTNEEQAEYYRQADAEKQRHEQLYPNWSTRDNYGKKRKRQRGNSATGVTACEVTRISSAPAGTTTTTTSTTATTATTASTAIVAIAATAASAATASTTNTSTTSATSTTATTPTTAVMCAASVNAETDAQWLSVGDVLLHTLEQLESLSPYQMTLKTDSTHFLSPDTGDELLQMLEQLESLPPNDHTMSSMSDVFDDNLDQMAEKLDSLIRKPSINS